MIYLLLLTRDIEDERVVSKEIKDINVVLFIWLIGTNNGSKSAGAIYFPENRELWNSGEIIDVMNVKEKLHEIISLKIKLVKLL